MEPTEIHAPHKLERNKKLAKTIKCVVCGTNISSGGYTCTICEVSIHKNCAVKIRNENCPVLEKELAQALSVPETPPVNGIRTVVSGDLLSPASLAGSSPAHIPSSPSILVGTPPNNSNLEIFFSDGSASKCIPYQPDVTLLTILNQIREERGELEGTYMIYDKTGKSISNYDQTLKKIKPLFPLFFTSGETKTDKSKKSKMRLSGKRRKQQGTTNNNMVGPQDSKPSTASSQIARNRKSLLQQKKFSKKPVIDISSNQIASEMMDQRNGTMSITVISVADLANQTSAYKFLYFTLTNQDNQSQRHRSQLLENNANPTWRQTIKFHMPYAFGQWNIKIWAIKKIDSGAADFLLGEADFILKGFKDGDFGMKTLVLRKEDGHKKDKKLKKVQLDFLQIENVQLKLEIEDEKKEKEILRIRLEELHKQIAQQQDAHNEEIKSIKYKIQRDVSTGTTSGTTHALEEEILELKNALQATKNELQNAKLKEEELKKNYEDQIEYYKGLVEGGKKNAKVLIQWSYQDRKLKTLGTESAGMDVSAGGTVKRMEWTPSKSRFKSSGKGGFLSRGTLSPKSPEEFTTSLSAITNDMQSPTTAAAAASSPSSATPKKEKKKKIQDVYEFGEVLGTGGSSVVREGTNRDTGQKVAIKILDNYDNVEDASDEEEAFWAEIEIIKQLDHPCVLNVYDFYEDSEHYYVVLELLSGNELFDQIIEKGSYEEPEAVVIIYQVLLALDHLATKSICHLDLKPENILFTDESHTRIKLIDFGEASSCKDHKLTGWVGTNNYMAPEMIKHLEYDTKVDMWSLGVVTYIMLCGSFAFDAEDEIELYQDIMEMRYEFRSPEWDDVSDEAKSFVTSLLTGPLERLSASEALHHVWIQHNLQYLPEHVRALGDM